GLVIVVLEADVADERARGRLGAARAGTLGLGPGLGLGLRARRAGRLGHGGGGRTRELLAGVGDLALEAGQLLAALGDLAVERLAGGALARQLGLERVAIALELGDLA